MIALRRKDRLSEDTQQRSPSVYPTKKGSSRLYKQTWASILFFSMLTLGLIVLLYERSDITYTISRWSTSQQQQQQRDVSDVLFLIFPSEVDPSMHESRIQAIQKTWGTGTNLLFVQDGLLAELGSSVTMPTLMVPGANWLHALDYVLKNEHRLKPWKWIAMYDACSFVLVDNLVDLTKKLTNLATPVAIGSRLQAPHHRHPFISRPAGTLMNRPAVSIVVKDKQTCVKGDPDMCFATLGIETLSAIDESGKPMIHVFGITRSLRGRMDSWYHDYKKRIEEPVRSGLDCCSTSSISFHYTEGPEQLWLWSILRTPTESDAFVDVEQLSDQQIVEKWPLKVGGYSRRPKESEIGNVRKLLVQLRKL